MFPIIQRSLVFERVKLSAPLFTLIVRGDGLFHQLEDLTFAFHQPLDLTLPHGVEELAAIIIAFYSNYLYLSQKDKLQSLFNKGEVSSS